MFVCALLLARATVLLDALGILVAACFVIQSSGTLQHVYSDEYHDRPGGDVGAAVKANAGKQKLLGNLSPINARRPASRMPYAGSVSSDPRNDWLVIRQTTTCE